MNGKLDKVLDRSLKRSIEIVDSGDLDNDFFYCHDCEEEYYLPENTICCPFCGCDDINLL